VDFVDNDRDASGHGIDFKWRFVFHWLWYALYKGMSGNDGTREQKTHLNPVFAMVIALFNPCHLPIYLFTDGHSILRAYNGTIVCSRRHEIAQMLV
jgi:hypothetical protein